MREDRYILFCVPTLSEAGAHRTVALIESASRGSLVPNAYYVVDNGGHFRKATGQDWCDRYNVIVNTPPSNVGVGPAWNTAMRAYPEADAFIFANDDITLAPDSLRLLDAVDGAMMVGTAGHSFSLFLMRPELLRKVGYFDEGFAPAYYEDTDYLRRMKLAGIERAIVQTGATHKEQSTSRDMGWDAHLMMNKQAVRYHAKWGGGEGEERFSHPWAIDAEVCVPSCHPRNLQRLIDSLAWQTVRPTAVTIATNAELRDLETHGLRVRQVKFWSDAYAIGEGDVSLRRNVATWAADAPYIVYSDDDQVWPQNAMEWFARRFNNEHFVVGHHRFVEGLSAKWTGLRTAKPDVGVSRETYPNQEHLWQSCWGGSLGIHTMLIKFGLCGWDMGYATSEDQQLAQRVYGDGEDTKIRVHEPPWAWHEKHGEHQPPWNEPHKNVCNRSEHDVISDDGVIGRCSKCPLVRRVDVKKWPIIQLYDPEKVRTEVSWL